MPFFFFTKVRFPTASGWLFRAVTVGMLSCGAAFTGCDSRPTAPAAATATGSRPPGADTLATTGATGTASAGGIATPTAATPAAPDSLHRLAPGRAGAVRIGMRVGELRARFGLALREVTLRHGGDDFPAFALGHVGATKLPALLLEPLCRDGEDDATGAPTDRCRIWRITVRDPAYRTVGGLGVGARYADIKHGAPLSFVGPNPMGVAATVEDWQMNFLLDPDAIEASKLPVHRETIHDSVRIVGVQLYR